MWHVADEQRRSRRKREWQVRVITLRSAGNTAPTILCTERGSVCHIRLRWVIVNESQESNVRELRTGTAGRCSEPTVRGWFSLVTRGGDRALSPDSISQIKYTKNIEI